MSDMLGPYPLDSIITGDARQLAQAIPDASVDLIFTDPPYPKQYLPLYGWLAETAARVLKPGGLCIALCGHFFVGDIWNLMSAYLSPFWIGGMGHSGSNAAIFPRKMWAAWKPMLWFNKPGDTVKDWTFDFLTPSKNDKRFHEWGQPEDHAAYYLERLTKNDDVTLDPFAGGGTVPAVCKILERRYLAFEIDPATAAKARQRVADTLPLFDTAARVSTTPMFTEPPP
jgi:DNA modification methylase